MALSRGRGMTRALLEGALRPYAQIVLSRRLVTGALVLAATATFPRAALASLVAVAVAQALTLTLGFGREIAREGLYAYSAALTALALVMRPEGAPWLLIVAGAALSVMFSAAFANVLARHTLPILSLPFVAATWIVEWTARLLPVGDGAMASALTILPAAWLAPGWLDVPAAVLFVHGGLAGALLIAAIAWHSRIALLLTAVGAAATMLVRAGLRGGGEFGLLDVVAAFNAVLTAMALGGVWYVPHPTSILLALLGGAIASLLTYALFPLTGVLAISLLSLPFSLATLLVIAALRMRERDRAPATTLQAASNPEDALERHLMRVRRFGDFAWLPFRLPFRGAWTVTQGHNGAHTHQGPWRHAFDFEIIGADGRAFEGTGLDAADYRCYNLPVLAAGTGTVESVHDGVADNPVAGMNARENWGNTVVIAHGSNLYSVYAHLKPGSIAVKPGDPVRAGAEVGRCGNSGRSMVPHLHFHVQRGAALGSETIAADFGDVVARSGAEVTVSHRVVPTEGSRVRPIMRDEALATALAFVPGSRWMFADAAAGIRESAQVEVDLWGRRALRSSRGVLYLESYENALVVVAFDGDHDSLLRFLLLALARVPFDQEGAVRWDDRVPRRLLSAWPWAFLDLLTVVAPGFNDWAVTYRARRSEGTLTVEGEGDTFRSRAVVELSSGALELTVAHGPSEHRLTVTPLHDDTEPAERA